MVKVLLIDVDSKMPNLALMKISAYHKSLMHEVFFERTCDPDEVYISCVFSWNKSKALGIAKMFNGKTIFIGGSGIDLKLELPYDIEHMCPDYDLYKERGVMYQGNLAKLNCQFDGSIAIGFTSRGCIRSCGFCLVPKKEGFIRDHAHITEFISDKRKVRLLDNNFLASPNWKENFAYINDHRVQVCFDQGLDIRLMTEEVANILADTHFMNRNFRYKQLYFAWDFIQDENAVRKGIEHLINAGIKPYNLAFYMLIGYNTAFYEDVYRFRVLRELKVDPFVMLFNNRKDAPILRHFQRWVNKRIYKSCSDFGKYDPSKGH